MTAEPTIARVIPLAGTTPISAVIVLEGAVVAAPGGAGLWTGEGPPPDVIPGAEVGDEYLDLLSGDLYSLQSGV